MNHRERLQTVLRGEIPDCVPVAPDFSNMIPAKRTGKPFWDLYLYNQPHICEAYVDCAKHFDIDSLMDGYFPLRFPSDEDKQREWETFIVEKDEEHIITQKSYLEHGERYWADWVMYYPKWDPPTHMSCELAKRPLVPESFEELQGVRPIDYGPEGMARMKALLGEQGLFGVFLTGSVVLGNEHAVMDYMMDPDKYADWAEARVKECEERFAKIMALDVKPDFLCVGGSGTLVFQTVQMFRDLALPAVKRGIELATQAGIPTHVHSCGPEKELVRIMAEETDLTVIDPLEVPPMGDCDLKALKKEYGDRIVLKGNLHTTEIMLKGSVQDVQDAAKKAIDDAAEGGRFILSTGDQCGRDTPPENLEALVEVARTYGKY
ncbi:MAG: uroporphyrinogen decarboxylase family protein [Candidatus Sumerlaeota bacterium]